MVYELGQLYDDIELIGVNYEPNLVSGFKGNIIPFPGTEPVSDLDYSFEEDNELPYDARPGVILPPEIPDFRPSLQRNGLLLLGWDKRKNEKGERYTAYWVTSTGTARFYASKQYREADFPHAEPDHKSYAAEDGIEFYGQESPDYIVHTAPELMMSNPMHGELRKAHIKALKKEGSGLDFKYSYLLTKERSRNTLARKIQKAYA